MICNPLPCRSRSSASGSKSSRTTLYCRQADSAAALLPSAQPDDLVDPTCGLADFYLPPSFVKFIGYVRAGPAAFRVGPAGQMEGNRFHLCASALFYACAEGLAVADEFHVPLSFRLAAAIAPRRRGKPARHQFSPLGTPINPADCKSCRYAIGAHVGCGLRAREACPPVFASRAAVPRPSATRWCQGGGHALWGALPKGIAENPPRWLSPRVAATAEPTARANEKAACRVFT